MKDVNDVTHREPNLAEKRRRGISLLEVMIAMSVLGFGMLALASAQLSAMKFSDQSRSKSDAHYLAQQQMEAFRAMTRAAIDAERTLPTYPNDPANPIDSDPQDGRITRYNRSWTIQADTPEIGVYTIAVSVGWTGRFGINRSVTIESYKSEF
jgi:prepilin-type N-terminal cleavage/methylation domain-containing protein